MAVWQNINIVVFSATEDVFLEHVRGTEMLLVKEPTVVIITRDLQVRKFHTAWVTVEIKMIHI